MGDRHFYESLPTDPALPTEVAIHEVSYEAPNCPSSTCSTGYPGERSRELQRLRLEGAFESIEIGDIRNSSRGVDGTPRFSTASISSIGNLNKIAATTVMYKDFLPVWGYAKEVGEFADQQYEQGKVVPMQACVGPAIPLATRAIFVFWPTYIAITLFGICSAQCTDEHPHPRLKTIYGIMMIFRILIEFRCLRYVTIPYIQTLGRFQWMSISISFQCWLIIVIGFLSVPNLIDMLTDSLFVISSSENLQCFRDHEEGHVRVMRIWAGVWRKYHVPWMEHCHYAFVSGAILLLTLTQMIYPLWHSLPRCWNQLEYEYTVGTDKTKFINVLGSECNLGDSLYQLADATGMGTLAVQQPEYPRARERMRREQHQQNWDAKGSLRFLKAALSEGMISVGLVGTLENTPQIMVQSFVFNIYRAAYYQRDGHTGAFETQTIVSICFSCIICLTKLWKTGVLLAFLKEVRKAIEIHTAWNLSAEAWVLYRRVRTYASVLVVWAILLIFGVALAAWNLFGSISCQDAVWVFGHGCISIEDILKTDG